MPYVAHRKQALAHKAFLQDGFKRGVLLMGRQCLHPDTLVRTDAGLVPIAEIVTGDKVLSHNGESWEYQPVINTWEYGVDVEPKPMIKCNLYGEEITATYDHPFYFSGAYVPLYQLVWGDMETGQREKLKLLCEQYGASFDYESIWFKGKNSSDETSVRQIGLSKDSSRRQDSQSTQTSSPDMDSEPQEQTRSESHRQQQNEQQSREPRVGDASRERLTLSQAGESSQQTGGELWYPYLEGIPSPEDTTRPKTPRSDSQRIRGFLVHNPRYSATQNVVSHIEVLENQVTYAIDVAENHNYCITESDILVANSGKTFFATQHSWISAILEQGRYFVVFKTYKQAHEVVWRQYIPLIPKELIYKKNEQDLLIELNYIKDTPLKLPSGETIMINHDENLPRSTIQLLGSDQADSHRGFRANGIIFDEYGDQDPDNWSAVYQPMFTTTNGWAIFMGTPRGFNHFYDLVQQAKEDDSWFFQTATWRDSPYATKEAIDMAKKDAEAKGQLSLFYQEYELEFRSVQGAVYPDFNRDVHLVKPQDIPEDLTYYATIDFGWHTTACLLVGIDKDQNWWVVDEVYGKEETLDNVIPRIKNIVGDKRLVLMVGDSANRDAIEVMSRDFPITGINKAADAKGYATGISLITQKLKPRMQLVGPPKPTMFISNHCKNFIFEMESYRFPEEKAERNPSDIPIKENDHGPDAIRYLALHLKFGLVKDDPIPKWELDKNLNSYGLL